jgi:hypothetical protein
LNGFCLPAQFNSSTRLLVPAPAFQKVEITWVEPMVMTVGGDATMADKSQ